MKNTKPLLPAELSKDDPFVIVALEYLTKKGNAIPWLMCGHISADNRLPCDLYLYATELDGVRKFGISGDAKRRGKKAKGHEEWRYKELLAQRRIPEKWKALVIESALKDHKNNNEVNGLLSNTGRVYGVELTSISVEEFNSFVDDCLARLTEDNVFEFCQSHCLTDGQGFFADLEHLRSGLISLWWNPRTKKLNVCNDVALGKSAAKFNYRVRKSAHSLEPIDIEKEAESIVNKSVKRQILRGYLG